MATAKEQFDALATQLDKVTTEILAEIKAFEDKIAAAGTDIPADAQASFDAIKAKIQALDDLNPDAPTTPPTP